ncbi:sodium:glutamate symporter [Billgrantia tianxiuensis]|jgi:ESS family glutamate:Na+ symporter|uniref:Sodium:glutamate symporter n=1 Tax=Billgrantia tianxiuensis TaxID=2497861 RepID=A0A6I6SN86_9GAMM|nr:MULTISPECIES: sodium/glutamate symporter [Halomonas]MCE8032087.1 sodium:glutamate symporter [Halomonas sp. MCCC 1A11057]QHC49874.1 sodium:glutamate symporter [Halomonas tianxiuensis]
MTMTVGELFIALVLVSLVLLASNVLRNFSPWLRRLFLPSSVVGGLILLLLGPEVLGRAVTAPFDNAAGLFPEYVFESWAALPGLLINVVFAALFIGRPIPGLRTIWMRAGPQVVVGQTMAWGQYVVGLTLAILVLAPIFGMNPMAGALIEIGFEGGHGTAAGMADTFAELGFEEGADLALGLATIGIVSGVLIGTLMINLAARRGVISLNDTGLTSEALDRAQEQTEQNERPSTEDYSEFKKDLAQEEETADPLSLHIGLVGIAIVIGWLILSALQWIEQQTWARDGGLEVLAHVPLFPIAMIGGVIVQLCVTRFGLEPHVSSRTMSRIAGTALDFTIVAALATLSLTALGEYLVPFLLLAAAGIAWCLFVLIVIAPRVIPENWFERGIGDFGQSMGVTVTGLLLMRMADPKNRSGAFESFGYKQLMFEPVVGGGLFTAASLPLIAQFGAPAILGLALVLTVAWLIFGLLYFGRMVPDRGRGRW